MDVERSGRMWQSTLGRITCALDRVNGYVGEGIEMGISD